MKKRQIYCKICGGITDVYAKDLCMKCYRREWRKKNKDKVLGYEQSKKRRCRTCGTLCEGTLCRKCFLKKGRPLSRMYASKKAKKR